MQFFNIKTDDKNIVLRNGDEGLTQVDSFIGRRYPATLGEPCFEPAPEQNKHYGSWQAGQSHQIGLCGNFLHVETQTHFRDLVQTGDHFEELPRAETSTTFINLRLVKSVELNWKDCHDKKVSIITDKFAISHPDLQIKSQPWVITIDNIRINTTSAECAQFKKVYMTWLGLRS